MNTKIVKQFELLVKKNQIDLNNAIEEKNKSEQTKQSFRLRTNKRVFTVLKNYPYEITIKNFRELGDIDGIGKGTLDKVKQVLEKGFIEELKDFKDVKSEKDEALKDLESVINIGTSKALELYNMGVKSVEDLKKKVNKKEIELNDKIMLGLKYYKKFMERIPRNHIVDVNKFLQSRIDYLNRKNKYNFKNKYVLTICGSYRRGKPESGDVDVLITKVDTKTGEKNLEKHLPMIIGMLKKPWKANNYNKFLVDDLTDITPTKYMGFGKLDKEPFRIDIRFVPYDSYYTALLYFTGSGEFNKIMRNIAKDKGYKLSEYSLERLVDGKKMYIYSEEAVFELLGMEYLEPRLR